MPLPDLDKVTAFDDQGLANLTKILDDIRQNSLLIRYTDTTPTSSTVQLREMVVYDDGAGTKRIYFKTGKLNLGYATLT